MSTSRVTRAVAVAALVVVGAAGCQNSDTPADPSPPPSTAITTPSPAPTSTSPSSTPAPTSLNPAVQEEAKATAAAEKAYRAWVKNYAVAAAAGFDPKKLDRRLATPAMIDYVTRQFKEFNSKDGAGKYTQDIRWMKVSRYLAGMSVELKMCAVTNLRFLRNGKDVTITSDGKPSPVKTEPTLRYVSVESIDDGKTWKSSTILFPSNRDKESC